MDQKRERKIWAAEIGRVCVGSPAQKHFKIATHSFSFLILLRCSLPLEVS
jgi:hypothetical protein